MIFEDFRYVPGLRSLHLFAGAGTDIMAAETAGLEPAAGGSASSTENEAAMSASTALPPITSPAGLKATQMLDQALDLAVTTARQHGASVRDSEQLRDRLRRGMGATFFLLPVGDRRAALERVELRDLPGAQAALAVLVAIAEQSATALND